MPYFTLLEGSEVLGQSLKGLVVKAHLYIGDFADYGYCLLSASQVLYHQNSKPSRATRFDYKSRNSYKR